MEKNLSLKELGQHLVQESKEEEFTAQRGLVNELFPFIYEASKRMSSRAISRWLEENHVKLSAVTIAKALRESKKREKKERLTNVTTSLHSGSEM